MTNVFNVLPDAITAIRNAVNGDRVSFKGEVCTATQSKAFTRINDGSGPLPLREVLEQI